MRWGNLADEFPPAFATDINPSVRSFLFIPETKPVFVRLGLSDEGLCLYKIGRILSVEIIITMVIKNTPKLGVKMMGRYCFVRLRIYLK